MKIGEYTRDRIFADRVKLAIMKGNIMKQDDLFSVAIGMKKRWIFPFHDCRTSLTSLKEIRKLCLFF
jgi:hypothetical protein